MITVMPTSRAETVAKRECLCPFGREEKLLVAGDKNSIYQIWECAGCGWRWTDPLPATLERSALYPENYRPFQKPTKAPSARAIRREGIPAPFGQRRALEIGCASGQGLRRLLKAGWRVVGIEPDPIAADRAREWCHTHVIEGSFPEVAVGEHQFELIVAEQVLEHLAEPIEAVRRMGRLLAPGGRILISVPNSAGWSARTFGADWIGWDLPRHLHHFTPTTLRGLVTSCGMTVESFKTLGHPSWLERSAQQAAVRGRGGAWGVWCRRRWGASAIARWGAWRGEGDSLRVCAARPVEAARKEGP